MRKSRLWGGLALGGAALLIVALLTLAWSSVRASTAQAQAVATGTRQGLTTVLTATGSATPIAPAAGTRAALTPVAVIPAIGSGAAVTSTATVTGTATTTSTVPALAPRGNLPGTITVVGRGHVKIKPDVAQANIGVESFAATVKEASAENRTIMDTVLAALKKAGIADKDMQTSGYNIYVDRTQSDKPGATGVMSTTYRVNNTVNVTIRDLEKVGAVLDEAIAAGANNIYGVSFSIEDPSPLSSEARKDAVADALDRAQQLARLNGVSVGQVISVSEVIGDQGGYVANNFADSTYAKGMGGGGVSIQPGELELTMQLQVTYAIQ